ncbi:MAG: hypothetical protein DYG91_10035 [Chloroflexi bacterium CFX7]|nr:MAG: hypothetical protein EDM76_01540 [bacterium]MCE7928818.1 hypothetical protein [Chloroflexi bacterium CFX7]RIL03231.1 MAG: hypothetical protein DCC78_04165 [bacterium]
MRTRTLALLLGLTGMALAGLGAFAAGSSPARAAGDCTTGDTGLDGEEQTFLTLINNYRSQNGLGTLTVSTNLNRAATWMTNDLGTNGYFSHTDSLGRSPYQRALDCGYPQGAGENLAAGTGWSSAQSAFDAWKNSPGHNANMLGTYYKQIGISRANVPGSPYGWYWATNFGATDDGTGGAPPPPPPTNTPTQPPTNTPTTPPTSTQPPASTPTPAVPPASTPTTAPTQAPTSTPVAPPTQAQQPPATTPTWQPTSTPTVPATSTPAQSPTATATPPKTPSPTSTPTNSLPLQPGANLLTWPGSNAPVSEALKGTSGVSAVYTWDAASGQWLRYIPGLPAFVNNLRTMEQGRAYWFVAKSTASLRIVD